jgi:hypothetical protein
MREYFMALGLTALGLSLRRRRNAYSSATLTLLDFPFQEKSSDNVFTDRIPIADEFFTISTTESSIVHVPVRDLRKEITCI